MGKPTVEDRARYRRFAPVTTRWSDNDVYGHVNNAIYNSWMDTAITLVIRELCPELFHSPIIPVAAETKLTFYEPLEHPVALETGFRAEHLGRSSMRCGVGIFVVGRETAAAWGHMVHVWVDRETNQSIPISDQVRSGLEPLLVDLQAS